MALKVSIDDPEKKYFPLESFLGKVSLDLELGTDIEVTVKLIGEEHTEYIGSSTTGSHTSFKGIKHRNFLETKSILVHSGYTNAGTHEYPFKVTLPKDIPSTCVQKYGYVKYLLKARVDQLEAEMELKVFSPIDLINDLRIGKSLLCPSTHSQETVVHRWWCLQREVEMEVRLERRVFVLGDKVNIRVNMTSSSCLHLTQLNCRLYLRVSMNVYTLETINTVNTHKLLAYIHHDRVSDARGSFFVTMKIPSDLDLPNFKRCTYFHQCLVLQVNASLRRRSNIQVKVNLVVAHTNGERSNCNVLELSAPSQDVVEPSTPRRNVAELSTSSREAAEVSASLAPLLENLPSPVSNVEAEKESKPTPYREVVQSKQTTKKERGRQIEPAL
ncbi:hypothetical protein NQ315_007389 [Exocentrus adspersus]|uniref:Arrestin C-terminal-like domain-containing protein n=1 Tax=Exocentrus adspersus TaxID=1586481 RepID=A0AAV8VI54_9CUCU|nr:hypothetical protein NQ315_007389 [Exocentrus adspersus]